MTYGQMFQQVALQFDLDWRLLAAQAYLESGFDSLALSGQGDMGLMQIRPATWNEWAPTVEASDPFDSYSNVLVGAAYLNHLRAELSARGYPQQEWMLVAYNWGPDKVFAHMDAGGTWESLDPERRQYAEDILRIATSIPPL
jgi:membrane-bound lytic murein transglycosylase F